MLLTRLDAPDNRKPIYGAVMVNEKNANSNPFSIARAMVVTAEEEKKAVQHVLHVANS
jgi:hypothetical protein